MSPLLLVNGDLDTRFPRVSGDEPRRWRALGKARLFSPRERG